MYYQDFRQDHVQLGSHGQFHDRPYSEFTNESYPSETPLQPNIVLDEYNSDLNFVIERDGVTGSSLHQDGFEYLWAGARATHGVRSGKVVVYIRHRILVYMFLHYWAKFPYNPILQFIT